MTTQTANKKLLSKQNKTLALALALCIIVASLGVVFHQPIIQLVTTGLAKAPTSTAMNVTNPPYRPLETVQYEIDGPPNYPTAIAIQSNIAVANAVDALVTANQGGAHVFVSYIDSRSFEHNALTITVPAIAAVPLLPSKPTSTDPFKQATLTKQYNKDYVAWQAVYAAWLKHLANVKAAVHVQTNSLRTLKPRFDNNGSSIWGGLDTASLNFQGVSGKKVLLLASTMIDNQAQPIPIGFSLKAVAAAIIYHNCLSSASACAANDSYWKQTMLHFGASSVVFSTVQQSQAYPLSL